VRPAGHYLPVFHVVQFAVFGQEQQATSVSCSGCITTCNDADELLQRCVVTMEMCMWNALRGDISTTNLLTQ